MINSNDHSNPLFQIAPAGKPTDRLTHQFTTLPPLALYVHLPWCERKCPYCDFNSHPKTATDLPEDDYISALIADLDSQLPQIWGRTLATIFIGGGTPSLFSAAAIDRLLSGIRQRLPFNDLIEVTMEANPGALDQSRLPDFRRAGVNRLSLGVQSFNDQALTRLGRVHDANQAQAAIDAAGAAGFSKLNIDLMYGLPDQTLQQAAADLRTALTFDPAHLSLYQLTLEPNTAFARQPPQLPDEDAIAGMQTQLQATLAKAGFEHYEVSAFCRPEQFCRHNSNYWQFGDYLGIGAGAHGKISSAEKIIRTQNIKDPSRYQRGVLTGKPQQETRVLEPAETVFEFMLNAMRLQQGVPLGLFSAHTGLPVNALLSRSEAARDQGLLEINQQRIKPTALGHRFLDNLTELVLPPDGE
ncbi:MAG: radical SAM family heme chaperone HemW [Gammaproteobacteria bacterium]